MPWLTAPAVIVALIIMTSLRTALQWDRSVVLRLGRFQELKGPGIFWIVPLLDRVARYVDMRIRATELFSERTLTKDTVPVNVDAICFWLVWVRDIIIPRALEDAMSMQAQAERERQARIILGTAETEIAAKRLKA